MDPERLGLLVKLLPKIPLAVRVALLHLLRLSEQSRYLDLRTELITTLMRSLLSEDNGTVSSVQKFFLRDEVIKGRIWVAKYATPAAPEESGVPAALLAAIEGLAGVGPAPTDALPKPPPAGSTSISSSSSPCASPPLVRVPELVSVEAEWTGYRAGASGSATPPDVSEREKYDEMMKECRSPVTILYLHGGAFWLMDPATHRATTKKLAKLTGGRCYSVRYRLAPQNPFPAALLDALVSYLALVHPPPGAFHEAVSPSNIVFAGDSAGGNLCMALTQTILELRRQNRRVSWLGEDRELPLPAGLALCSPWMDVTGSSPSCENNQLWDYLPTPEEQDLLNSRPPCKAWPVDPPRRNLYADDHLLLHPLVSPVATPGRCWEGCPPVYMCTGWELLADEDRYVASRLAGVGVPVVFEEYEGMSHCFAMIFGHLEGARRCLRSWTDFIVRVAGGSAIEHDHDERESVRISSSFTTIKAKSLEEVAIAPDDVASCSEEKMKAMIQKRIPALFPAAKL